MEGSTTHPCHYPATCFEYPDRGNVRPSEKIVRTACHKSSCTPAPRNLYELVNLGGGRVKSRFHYSCLSC